MDLNIQGRNIEITRSMKEHVAAKLASLDRHLPAITRAEVEMASESTRSQQDRVVVQVSLNVGGELLRAQRRAANARAAVNAAAEALDRQVNRWKSQNYRSERIPRNAPDADVVVQEPWSQRTALWTMKCWRLPPATLSESSASTWSR